MNITISGLPGTGTTTVGNLIAEKLNMRFVSTGELFRQHAKSRNMTLAEYGKLCEENPEEDRILDLRQEELSKTMDNTVFEGRIAGFKCHAALKVWLYAPADVRAKRIAGRENKSIDIVRDEMFARQKSEKKRYKTFYGIDLDDTSIYDIVIDSSKTGSVKIAELVAEKFNKLKKTKI